MLSCAEFPLHALFPLIRSVRLITLAGHIQAGDEPLESAIRELKEELGISAVPEQLHFAGTFPISFAKEFHGKMFRDEEIAFVYIFNEPVYTDELILQTEAP